MKTDDQLSVMLPDKSVSQLGVSYGVYNTDDGKMNLGNYLLIGQYTYKLCACDCEVGQFSIHY